MTKMLIVYLAVLTACAYTEAAVQNDIFTGTSIDSNLGYKHLQLNSLALDNEVSAEDQLLIEELTHVEEAHGRNFIADTIKDALEGFRDVVINGNGNIPPLDPLVIDKLGPIEYSAVGIRASASIDDARVEGLRWYVVDYVTVNTLRLGLGLQLTLPWLTATGKYDINARIALISHRARGNFRIFVNRFELGIDLRLGTNLASGNLLLRELDIKLDIHDTRIQIDGMTGSSLINNFISSLLQNITHDVIQSEIANVGKFISDQLFDVINEVLKDFTLGDLLG